MDVSVRNRHQGGDGGLGIGVHLLFEPCAEWGELLALKRRGHLVDRGVNQPLLFRAVDQSVDQSVNHPLQIRVGPNPLLYRPDAVQDGGMVPVERQADLRHRQSGDLAGDVHGDLAGPSELPPMRRTQHMAQRDAKF